MFDAAVRPYVFDRAPRNVYWETTIACDLACKHCRAHAVPQRDPEELTHEQAKAFIDDVHTMGSLLVLTGGDPMKRPDLFELIAYARSKGQPIAVTPSTTPTLTRDVIRRFSELGVEALGVSLDGPDPAVHDTFRGVPGTFETSQRALEAAAEFGIPVQVNTTVCRYTYPHLRRLFEVLKGHSPPVKRWSLFVLVPTGRGTELEAPTTQELRELFEWVYDTARDAPFHVGTVEAPQYRRYWIQRKMQEGATWEDLRKIAQRMGFGMRDGNGVIFVARNGEVFPAGFLPFPKLGNVKTELLSTLYREHPALAQLRDMDQLKGKCGQCEARWICGGSRARAYGMLGDVMQEEPLCDHLPGETAGELLI
jgi:radical SAM protein